MSLDLLEQIPPLLPLEFFSLTANLLYIKKPPNLKKMDAKFLLPDTSELLGEEKFADCALAYNEEGIWAEVRSDQSLEKLELFFDTRDLKTVGYATRFCHHFSVFTESQKGVLLGTAQEVTHFRSDDVHELCDPSDLHVTLHFEKKVHRMRLFIPAHCLHGYDLQICDKIGFTYRIHSQQGTLQHFAMSSMHFNIEQSPRLWASLLLDRG